MKITLRTLLGWLIISLVILAALWVIPLEGTILILDSDTDTVNLPMFELDPRYPEPGESVVITVVDSQYWSFTHLTVDTVAATPIDVPDQTAQLYTWRWSAVVPDNESFELVFYVDCHTGCQERGAIVVGERQDARRSQLQPTKLGVVMPNPGRDWHDRRGWAVEVTYATQSEASYWGIDDLASRVQHSLDLGLNVIIRVDYDLTQSLPAENDHAAMVEYLSYLARLAGDDRLASVYGYVIGSDMNVTVAETGQQAISPQWYARLLLGYGEPPESTGHALQVIHDGNPNTRVIVGSVRPWVADTIAGVSESGEAPWLAYMRVLVSLIDETLQYQANSGMPLNLDGFDVQAPADIPSVRLPDQPEYEPNLHQWDARYSEAHIGFRVYEDWLAIINGFESTQGLPVYIISTNTYQRASGATPAETYVSGWLTNALGVVNHEPQIKAMCWFLDDFPNTDQWDAFSLTEANGRLREAADEFDKLLQEQGAE